jgi:prevent-host-death family protein
LTSLIKSSDHGNVKLTYSIYEAKARFSELIRMVKQGKRITITDRGREVARVVPLEEDSAIEQKMADLRAAGILGPPATGSIRDIRPIAHRPGVLARFLAERD